MKTYKYLLGLGVAAMSLSSCSNDAIEGPDTPQGPNKEMTKYIAIAITGNSPQSRAVDYTGGIPGFDSSNQAENNINSIYLMFYDKNGDPVGEPIPVNNTTPIDITTANGNIAAGASKIVTVTVPASADKDKEPVSVMCFVNPRSLNALNQSLYNIETTTRTSLTDADGNFSMTNSVYYDETTGNIVRAVNVEKQLYKTEKEAIDALAAGNATIINVERYAAKVKFSYNAEKISTFDIPTVTINADGSISEGTAKQTLTFTPTGWQVNTTNAHTYVTKLFRTSDALGTVSGKDYTYTEENNILNARGRGWTWNSPANTRSFWANSPAYYLTSFPETASDIKANGVKNDPTGTWIYKDMIHYFDFNDVHTDNANAITVPHHYYLESTVSQNCFTQANNPAASAPSLILTGQYKIGDNDAQTFYTYKIFGLSNTDAKTETYICAGVDANGKSTIEGIPSMMNVFFNQSKVVYLSPVTNTDMKEENMKLLVDDNTPIWASSLAAFEIDRPSDAVIAKIGQLASRKATLQLKSTFDGSAIDGNYICVATGSGIKKVVPNPTEGQTLNANEISLNDANVIIAGNARNCDVYTNGYAYFTQPIVHLGFYAGTNPNKNTETGALVTPVNWSAARVGDFGLVRNHVYDIYVNSITGFGIAVREVNDPIVPPKDEVNYYMAMQLNVLSWAVVPQQVIDFK